MTETPDPTQTPALTDRLALEADVADEEGTAWLADLLREAAVTLQQDAATRRAFLERAVCHPGPPMSEQEDYDPDADLDELEGSVLERMDMETRWHRELMEIRREAEGILARTPDPSRSTVQVFKDFVAFHHHLAERVTAAIALLNSSLVSRENIERAELLLRRGAAVDVDNGQRDAVAEHIRAAGGIGQKGVASTIEVTGGDAVAELGLAPPAVKLQWDSPDIAEVSLAPPARMDLDGFIARHKGALNSPETRRRIAEDLTRLLDAPPAPTPKVVCVSTEAELARGEARFEIRGANVPAATKGTSYEEASEWAGAPPDAGVLRDGKVDMPRLAAAWKHLESVTRPPLMPVEIVMQIVKPEATSVIWAGEVISTGDANLSLQMEDPVHELSVFNFEDSMGRVRKQSGKGRLWLALDDDAAERLGHYRGAGIDGPVSLTLLWPSSDTMRFEVRLHGDALDDDEGMPKTRAGAGKAWHGYRIEVCPYPGPAADLFQIRNRP